MNSTKQKVTVIDTGTDVVRSPLPKDLNGQAKTEQEQDTQIRLLKSEVDSYKSKYERLESKYDQNQGMIVDLRSKTSKILVQEDSHIQSALKEKKSLDAEIRTLFAAVKTLEEDGKHMQEVTNWWQEFIVGP
jgi:FtsZ-binding cell division protein ZapB